MQKKSCYLIGLACLATFLTGCGGSSTSSAVPTTHSTAASVVGTAASSVGVTASSVEATVSSSSAASVIATTSLVLPESLEVVTK